MIWFLVPRVKGSAFRTSKEWAAMQVAEELCEHWIWCNVYPKHPKDITKSILNLYGDFKKLQGTHKDRTEQLVEEKVKPFMQSLDDEGMDIRTIDLDFRRKQEEQYGVKETPVEKKLKMICAQLRFCQVQV